MKASIVKFFTTIKTYIEYYLTVVTVIGALWGGFVIYDNWKDNNSELQKNVKTIIETQNKAAKTDSILLENQSIMAKKLEEIGGTTSSLQSSYVKYISNDKTLTKQDFLRYMEGLSFDTKKNLLNSLTESQSSQPLIVSQPTNSNEILYSGSLK